MLRGYAMKHTMLREEQAWMLGSKTAGSYKYVTAEEEIIALVSIKRFHTTSKLS